MTQDRPDEPFETYPWATTAEPAPPAAPEPPMPPGPPPLPRPHAAPVVRPTASGRLVGRRVLIGGVAGVGAVIALGGLAARSLEGGFDGELAAEASSMAEEEADGEDTANLDIPQKDLYITVPNGWTIANSGTSLLIIGSDPDHRLAAHAPGRLVCSEDNLMREASYLRDEFDPAGESTVSEESTQIHDILRLHTQGAGVAGDATEQVTLILDPVEETGLVVSLLLPARVSAEAGRAARGMVDELLRGFRDY